MNRWMPIETAPLDETEILILTSRGVTQARFSPGEWTTHHEYGPEYSGAVWVCCDDTWQVEIEETPEGNFHGEATHWMPLPEAPQ